MSDDSAGNHLCHARLYPGLRPAGQDNVYYTYPIGRIHSLENVAQWAAPEFDRMGIQYETLFNMKEVDGQNVLILGDMTNIPISKARLYHSL